MSEDLRARVQSVLPGIRSDLEDLVRIESVSADPERAGEVQRSAEAVKALFDAEGFTSSIVSADGGAPAVIAHKAGPEGAPTVLLYAHHDVQPENSETLPALLAEHQESLRADVIVIADSGNWDIGVPALTTSLRGLVRMDIEVRTLTHAVHSGMWGGLVPDSLMALSRVIASLHDDEGNVAIEGLHSGPAADVEYPEDRLRAESGAAPGIEWIGSGSAVERLWTKPALSITGLDAPKVAGASNTLVPAARARISMRIAPGDTAENAVARLVEHLEAHTPWGATLTHTVVDTGEATQIDATGPAYDAARSAFTEAWDGTEPIDMGVGGSIPFIAEFLEAFPQASVLVTGVEDPDTRAHGANEGLHLAEFERVVLAETLLLATLGAQ